MDALYNKGLLLSELGRPEDALDCLDTAIQRDPGDAKLLAEKASQLGALSRYKEAVKFYDAALAIEPDNAATLYNKAKYLWLLDMAEESMQVLEAANKINPDLPDYAIIHNMLKDRLEFNHNIHGSCND